MQRRINVSLSEEAVRLLDRMAPKGDRRRFLDELVKPTARDRAAIRTRLKAGAGGHARSNYVPRRAPGACGAIRAGAPKRATSSPPVYAWFTEGFDTRDLTDAQVLVPELG